MAQSCSVMGCLTKTKAGQDPGHFKFYRFPKDANLLEKWKMALKNNRIGTYDRICNLHFTESDYKLTNLGWKVLIPSAVPTLNLPVDGLECVPCEALGPIKVEAEEGSSSCVASLEETNECCVDTIETPGPAEESHNNDLDVSTDDESNSSHDSETSDKSNNMFSCRRASKSRKEALSCQSCNKQFDTRLLLLLHMSVHYESELFPCLKCKEKFISRSKLKNHICKSKLSKKTENLVETVQEMCPPFFCDQCGLTFDCRNYLKCHTDAVQHSKSYCSLCNIALASKAALRRHVKSMHLGKRFVCSDCDRLFGSGQEWVSHIGLHALPYECPECCEQLKGIIELDEHLKCHTSMIFYCCNFCELLFSSVKAAEAHQQMKKHKGARVECHFCKRNLPFGSKYKSYHEHRLITSETNPSWCSQEERTTKKPCIDRNPQHWFEPNIQIEVADAHYVEESAFVQSQTDNQMNSASHPFIKEEILEDDMENNDASSARDNPECLESPEVAVKNEAFKLKCEDCNKVLGSNSEMKLHRDQHKSRGDFSCIECGKQYNSNAALTKHYSDHVKYEADDNLSLEKSE